SVDRSALGITIVPLVVRLSRALISVSNSATSRMQGMHSGRHWRMTVTWRMAQTAKRRSISRGRRSLEIEILETRDLLAGFLPMPVEQLFLEQLNDARADPAAYGASIGLDLSGVAPSQSLAFNPELIEAARLHSQDMNARAYFSHVTPEGYDPGQRI